MHLFLHAQMTATLPGAFACSMFPAPRAFPTRTLVATINPIGTCGVERDTKYLCHFRKELFKTAYVARLYQRLHTHICTDLACMKNMVHLCKGSSEAVRRDTQMGGGDIF